ncbi:hypothetical protein Taro_017101 [Colocasia esculenta]|uniref:Uncharacterized protein n=1 Tax=Colocasia esculenta TaxID=4460 RepID=A0A843UMP1_COLES|nr:hypothetical protein [Colocasia esculenta]
MGDSWGAYRRGYPPRRRCRGHERRGRARESRQTNRRRCPCEGADWRKGPPVRYPDRRPSWLAEGAASQGPDWRPSCWLRGPPVRGLTGAPPGWRRGGPTGAPPDWRRGPTGAPLLP